MNLPSIPTPPTDNLYKFWAIGLLIAGLTFMIWSQRAMDEQLQENHELDLEIARAKIETDFAREELERLKAQEEAAPDHASRAAHSARRAAVVKEAALRVAELDVKADWQKQLAERARARLAWQSVLLALVLASSLLNFWTWYHKVQRHQDELLKLQVEAARRTALAARESATVVGMNSATTTIAEADTGSSQQGFKQEAISNGS